MAIRFRELQLPGVVLVDPMVFEDERGFFLETFHRENYRKAGIPAEFVQDNHSRSKRGTVRGLHYQLKSSQGKLIYVVSGEIFDVCVDIRRGSPSFGKWAGETLSSQNHREIFVPSGFAHGFCVLSETADVYYKCTNFYRPDDEYGILWNDPDIHIDWPIEAPVLSKKDRVHPKIADIPDSKLPPFADLPVFE